MLILLFVDSGFSKYFDYSEFKRAMHNQPFPFWFAELSYWIIPPVEILIATALMFAKTRAFGQFAFLLLMILYTLYSLAILFHVLPVIPCNCGELIKSLSWRQHFLFNLLFVFLAIYDIRLRKELS